MMLRSITAAQTKGNEMKAAKKLTSKSDVLTLAHRLAGAAARALGYSAHDIEKMDYDTVQGVSRIAHAALTDDQIAPVPARYMSAFETTFKRQFVQTLHDKARALVNSRRDFSRLLNNGITQDAANEMIADVVKEFTLRGDVRVSVGGDYGRVEVRRGRNVDATLYINFERANYEGVTNPDKPKHRVMQRTVECQVSWSSTQSCKVQFSSTTANDCALIYMYVYVL